MIEGAPTNKSKNLKKIEIVNDTENDIDLSENVDLLFHNEIMAQGTPATTKATEPKTKKKTAKKK